MWLIGHSDGASIAPLYAARFIDADLSIESIKQAKAAYERGDLRARLARYHADVDSKFYGWNDIWLDPAFRAWSMVGELATIRAPPEPRRPNCGTRLRSCADHSMHAALLFCHSRARSAEM
ncbi:hypothetical protein F4827_001629 [Paraburkholderia bannensis]|uniref:Alpha/beta hydrolase n=1 Tax=Paraburkholderia bannensis TaxID=765414 RepID=A0A7W9TW46_9BURK|nr:hypothetical protein [Paraburkholderia sp. WP4_3_2]MBB6101781.1 hypothetical protein [Paraburkholderia bannensis]